MAGTFGQNIKGDNAEKAPHPERRQAGRKPKRVSASAPTPKPKAISAAQLKKPASASASADERKHLADLLDAIAQNKDRQAFKQVFQHFAPRLKGYLIRLGSPDGQAEELVQDVMLTVWRKAHMFDRKKAAASTWLFTIARNRRIDILRREKYPELDPNDPALVPDDPAQPDEEVMLSGRREEVLAAIKDLPEEQAELIRLAFYKGWSHSEIAAETGLPLGTVKSRLRLSFARLRGELDGKI